MSELLDLFKNQGKSIEAPANFRLSLQEKGHIWLLEKGSMILFAVEKKGEVEGRRILLSTLETGDFIFPMELEEESSFEIFAFSEQEVSLKKLPLDHLKGANIQEEFSYKLDHWIHQFSSLVVTDIEVKVDQWAFESDSFILKKGEIF